MTYDDAKRLRSEDEVLCKETGKSLYVISTDIDPERKKVIVLCDDGNFYHHRDIK